MSNSGKFVIAILFASMCSHLPPKTWASEAFLPVTPEELTMTSEPKAPGAPAIYLYRQVDRDDDRNAYEYNYLRIKILTEEGRKYADVEIPFVKELSHINGIKARTIQPDGTTIDFNGKVYEKTVVKAKGLKYLAKTFVLPDVRVGTIIDYSYTVDEYYGPVYDSRWILSSDLFTKKARFSLKPTSRFGVRWNWPNGLPQGTPPPAKRGREIRLETEDVPAFQTEDYMPPEDSLKLRVDFVYTFGSPETDPTKFWKQQGKSWYQGFDSFVDKKKAMEQAVAGVVSPSDSPEAKVQKIYARVLQIRNLSFEKEKTEQEVKREKLRDLNNVDDVWNLGYGSARAVNWLFIALTRAAGIEADCVFVSPRSSYLFDPRALNAGQLDDDIVLVKLSGKDIYLDPGSKFAPFGSLPWYETQVQGLVLDKDGGKWVQTSLPSSSSATTERKADLTLSEDGTLEGKLTVTYAGLEALEMRTEEREQDDASRKASLEDLVKEAVPADIEVELTNKPDWTSAAPTLVAEYHLKVRGWVAAAGRRTLLPIELFGANERHLFEPANRVYPIYFHNPYLRSDEVAITLPSGWKVTTIPSPVNQDAKAVAYTVKAEDNNGVLHISRTLRSEFILLDKQKYGALRSFFQLVRTGDEQQVVLQPIG